MVKKRKITIRNARMSDAETLASLAGELGYPTAVIEMEHRLKVLGSDPLHSIFVAEEQTNLGWIHVKASRSKSSSNFSPFILPSPSLHLSQRVSILAPASAYIKPFFLLSGGIQWDHSYS
jgi:hypothetical protein